MLKLDVPWDALSFVFNDELCSTVLHKEIDKDINFLCSIVDNVRQYDLYDPWNDFPIGSLICLIPSHLHASKVTMVMHATNPIMQRLFGR